MQSFDSRAQWPGWETVRIIGRGSYGAVYEIRRNVFGHIEKAALKVISVPRDDGDIDDLLSDGYDSLSITQRYESYLRKIVEEYTHMADMKGHPNIVYCDDVHYVRHVDGIGWDVLIKMELLTPLREKINAGISEEMVRKIAVDISSALMFCESKGLLHRDIKPQNIFVTEDGTYKLGDFGVAKATERTVTIGTAAGTYKYMAPEVYYNQPYGAKADMYSFGLTLYWLLNERRLPFLPLPPAVATADQEENARLERMRGTPLPPPAHGSEELKRIVLKACAFSVQTRCSAKEMHEMLTGRPVVDEYANAYDEEGDPTINIFHDSSRVTQASSAVRQEVSSAGADVAEPALQSQVQTQTPATDEPTKETHSQKKKRWLPVVIGAGAVAVIAILLLSGVLRSGEGGDPPPTEAPAAETAVPTPKTTPVSAASVTPAPTAAPTPAQTAPEETPGPDHAALYDALVWTQWSDTLPANVQGDDYAIESREVFRSVDIQKLNYQPGANYVILSSNVSSYGAWSAWQTNAIARTATLQVETRQTDSSWSAWSDWIQVSSLSQAPAKTASLDVETSETSGSWSDWSGNITVHSRDEIPAKTATLDVLFVVSVESTTNSTFVYRTRTWIPGNAMYRTRSLIPGTTEYRSRTVQYTYVCYDNTKWTDPSTEFIKRSDQRLIRMQMQYRYAPIGDDWTEIPSTDYFMISNRDYTLHYLDVDDAKWYGPVKSKALQTADEYSILYPDAEMNFRPDEAVTVGDLIRAVVIVHRTYMGYTGLICANDGNNQPYADYAVKTGLLLQGEFSDLNAEATRGELAYLLGKALPEDCLTQTSDIASILDMDAQSPYYQSVLLLARAGVIDANAEKAFQPDKKATRAQAASLIEKLVQPSIESSVYTQP